MAHAALASKSYSRARVLKVRIRVRLDAGLK